MTRSTGTPPPTINQRRHYNAADRAQLAQTHAAILRANGLPDVPEANPFGGNPNRGGRRRRGADLVDIAPPTTYASREGSMRERDVAFLFSGDGRRLYGEVEPTAARPRANKRQRIGSGRGSGSGEGRAASNTGGRSEDAWAEWTPVGDVDAPDLDGEWEDEEPSVAQSGSVPSDTLDPGGEEVEEESDSLEDGEEGGSTTEPTKAKRYQSSDDPMSIWLPLMDRFMGEIMVHEHPAELQGCVTCQGSKGSSGEVKEAKSTPKTLYRCETCGNFLECLEHCLERHRRSPLHVLRVSRGKGYFERVTLAQMGLEYQLGHAGGHCAVPRGARTVTVIHVNGIHRGWKEPLGNAWYPATTANPQTFATFEVLDLFRQLNVTANVNLRDFVTALERLTDAVGVDWVPDRYKAFGTMARQWTFLLRIKRSGIGHLPGGIKSAPLGSAAVKCWACPRPRVNMPEGWQDVEENLRFKHALILGLDANFRMESKLRKKSKNKAYPILADGLGCVVPSEDYKEHLRKYVKEDDVSTCIGFAALMQKETRQSSGLRCTGVGGCICTRHEVVRRLGDLVKGERYANMDYVFWSSVLGEEVADILVSYDIGCQWKINLEKRRSGMPAPLKAKPPNGQNAPKIRVATPVWHGAVHEEECMMTESLRYKEGAGMSEGEGVERVWSELNGCATSTKEMQDDARHETLEDVIDNHNFRKNLTLISLIPRRLEVAREERAKQLANFQSSSFALGRETREAWEKDILAWHAEEDIPKALKKAKNPYVSRFKKDDLSETTVRRELQEEEETEVKALGGGLLPKGRKSSQMMFLTIGERLLGLQLRIQDMLKARVQLGLDREEKLARMRASFFKALPRFRSLQESYMGGVGVLIDKDEELAAAKGIVVAAESVKLWLPEQIPKALRPLIGRPQLYEAQARLCRTRCSTALQMLRIRLHAKRHMIMFRNAYLRGQKKTSRARSLIDSVSDRIDAQAARYRIARESLFELEGEGGCGEFRVLEKEDITLRYVQDHDGRAARRLAKIAGRPTQAMMQGTDLCDDSDDDRGGAEERGESRRTLSWIWTAQGAPEESEEYLHDSVRVEWCRSYARKERWREEVGIGEAEEERTLLSLKYEARVWRERAESKFGSFREQQGRRAYALHQAALYDSLHAEFVRRWRHKQGSKRKRRHERVDLDSIEEEEDTQ